MKTWFVVVSVICGLWVGGGIAGPLTVWAQGCDKPNMLIVLDNSDSMNNSNKLTDANKAIAYVVQTFTQSIRFGLMTFCGPKNTPVVPVVVKISDTSNPQVVASLPTKTCNGTPMVGVVTAVKNYFTQDLIPNDPKQPRPNFVMFVTDGASTDGDPVPGVKTLRTIKVNGTTYDIKTFVVGFGQGVKPTVLADMATSGGTANYYQANDHKSLQSALHNIAQQVSAEICDDKDNNCDGKIDELWPTKGQSCSAGSGPCKDTGTWGCKADGSGVECSAKSRQPSPEVCDGQDNDCNGKIDDGIVCECKDKESRPCTTACGQGKQQCINHRWGPCEGSPVPAFEICDGKDNDCDGQIDEDLVKSCTTTCGTGIQRCEKGTWTACSGPQPQAEVCDGIDNDCDGQVDVGATCPEGAPCVDGVCRSACRQGECSGDQTCDKGFCLPKTTCQQVKCASDQRCVGSRCIGVCEGVSCPSGSLCFAGRCVTTDCYVTGCPQGQVCLEGKCQSDPCAKINCSQGQVCLGGQCIASCQNVSCAAHEFCLRGKCVPNSCHGVSCKTGEVCLGGTCQKDPCAAVQCPAGRTCAEGECRGQSTTCGTSACPAQHICVQERCLALCGKQICPQHFECVQDTCVRSSQETAAESSSSESVISQERADSTESGQTEPIAQDAPGSVDIDSGRDASDGPAEKLTRAPGCACQNTNPVFSLWLGLLLLGLACLRRQRSLSR